MVSTPTTPPRRSPGRPADEGTRRPRGGVRASAAVLALAASLSLSCGGGHLGVRPQAAGWTASQLGGVTLGPGWVEVLEDPSAALALADVSARPHCSAFVPLDQPSLSRGVSASAFWLRFEAGPTSVPLLLEIDNPTLTTVSVYRLDDRGRLEVTHTGQGLPVSTREVPHPSLLFEIQPAAATTVHVRVTSRSPLRAPLRLWRHEAFHAADRLSALRSGLFYGGMALAAVFQVMIVLAARDRSYLAFVAAVVMACVTLLGMDGLGAYYLWPGLATRSPEITTTAGVLTVLSLLAFTTHFLELGTRVRRAHRLLVATGLVMALTGLLVPRTLVYQVTAALSLVVMLAVGIHSWHLGHAPARRFVAGWVLLAAGIIAGQFALAGVATPGDLRADQLYRLAALPAVAVFSVSLADRLWMLRRTAEASELALRRQEQTLVEVARGVVGTTGQEVFTALVRHVARALDAHLAFVGELDEAAGRVHAIAVWADEAPADTFDYALAGSPCEDVARSGPCAYADGVQERFPRDAALARQGIRGYVGAPLQDSTGRPIGLLVCLFREPIADLATAQRTLQLFAGRAASELERRRAERALAEREALLGALLESSPALIYVKDPEGRYLLVNRQYERRMGLSRDAILGRTDAELMPPQVAEVVRGHDLEVLESDEPKQFEEGGGGQAFLSTKAALRDAGGLPWAMIGVSTDITEFQRLQAQLRVAQRMEAFGQLAGGLAHDFNNLLTAILGYIDLCEAAVAPDTDVGRDLAEARRATMRAATITGQLLAFARRQPSTPQVVDLNRVVRDVERLLRQAAGTTVALQVSLCEYPVRVRLDPSQFDQVILNLVLNARDAMPGGGTVRIETGLAEVPAAQLPAGTPGHAGRYATLRVSDSGHGIAEADLNRLFEPFFTTKPPGRGTGLGLAMCHGIVRQAGGFIAVSSTPGQGASFAVHVPEAMTAETSPTASTAPRPAGGTETILLVEDEAAVRRFAARVLEGKGYRVATATDGEQALALARDFDGPLDLLLTDVSMPGISGRELAAALRAERPGIAVLYMSGYGERALAEDGLVADGSPYLSKPFTGGVLASAVRETLDRRRPQIG